MTPLRTLAAVAGSAVLVAVAAALVAPARSSPPANAEAPPVAMARPSPPPGGEAPAKERRDARAAGKASVRDARPQVPPSILARAADARALDRGPSCAPAAAQRDASPCPPESRESIEIEWHVGRDR